MIVFFSSITFAGIGLILKKSGKNPELFTKYYLIVMVARLMLSLSIIGGALYLKIDDRIVFVINFLILYLSYLGFEIYYLIVKFQVGIFKNDV